MKKARTHLLVTLVVLAGFLILPLASNAGDLEPSAAPGSTMKTLDEVEPRIPINADNTPGDFNSEYNIISSGSYYLTGNITTAKSGITVLVDDVTIDLCGFILSGPDDASTKDGIVIPGPRSNTQIRNGTIRDFRYAVNAGTGTGKNQRVENVRAISNTTGGIYLNNANCTVTGCTIADNGDTATSAVGIKTFANAIITGNTIANNGTNATGNVKGIDAYTGSVITGNAVYNNGDSATGDVFGINAGEGSTLMNNTAYDNGTSASGDYVAGIHCSRDCNLMNNTASNNGSSSTSIHIYGIYTFSGSTVTGNTAIKNGASATNSSNFYVYGMFVGSDCMVTGNTASYNGTSVIGQYYNVYGIGAGNGSIVKGNIANSNGTLVDGSGGDVGFIYGIEAGNGCMVADNTAYYNGQQTVSYVDIYGIKAGEGNIVRGNTAYYNGNGASANSIRGIKTSLGCTVIGNTSYKNGNGTMGIGINLGDDNFVDQNTAFGNFGINMTTPASGLVTPNNHAP